MGVRYSTLVKWGGWILCLISLILSVILFGSSSDDPMQQMLWGAAAIGFELIKFSLIPIAVIAFSSGKKLYGWLYTGAFLLLMFVSVVASIGSLSKNTESRDIDFYNSLGILEGKKVEIENLQAQIDSRLVSIERYQELDEHKVSALPLITLNSLDNEKIAAKRLEIQAIALPERSALSEGISLVAAAINIEAKTIQANVFIVFSLLLDFFGALAIAIGELTAHLLLSKNLSQKKEDDEAKRKDKALEREHQVTMMKWGVETEKLANQKPRIDTPAVERVSAEVVPIAAGSSSSERVRAAVESGMLPNPPTVRAMVKNLGIDKTEAERIAAEF
jgi:hypothetical protein